MAYVDDRPQESFKDLKGPVNLIIIERFNMINTIRITVLQSSS